MYNKHNKKRGVFFMWVTKIDGTRVASYTNNEMQEVLDMSSTSMRKPL